MKRSLIYLVSIIVVLSGCRKNDNPRIPELTEVPLPFFEKDPATSLTISAQDPTTFNATFSVDNYFQDGTPAKEMDIVIIKNGDNSTVKMLTENVTTFPANVALTGQQLMDLFGEPIELGDRFEIGADVTTQNDQVFLAFPAIGNAYAAGIAAMPGAVPILRYEAVCSYISDDYQGTFEVVTDEWADYAPGTEITVTKIDETHFSFEFLTDDPIPVVVEIDPATNEASVAKQGYGDYSAFGITGMTVESVAPASDNYVAPCEGVVSVRLAHFDGDGGFYGNNLFVLKKVE